jgi:hypothetical protein
MGASPETLHEHGRLEQDEGRERCAESFTPQLDARPISSRRTTGT